MADDFDAQLEAALNAAEEALEKGPYRKAMRELLDLSMSEIRETVPGATFAQYSKLLTLVEQASAANLAQAALRTRIEQLGRVTLRIARMVPALAGILA